MSEHDARSEMTAREERAKLEREQGQHILDLIAARKTARKKDGFLGLLQRAHGLEGTDKK